MAYEVKVFLVTEVLETGGERVIKAKLRHEDARAIALEGPNRKVTRLIADKED
jgi:hypothetical protein